MLRARSRNAEPFAEEEAQEEDEAANCAVNLPAQPTRFAAPLSAGAEFGYEMRSANLDAPAAAR